MVLRAGLSVTHAVSGMMLLALSNGASAQLNTEAVGLLTETATAICGNLQLKTDGYKLTIDGEAEARLNGLLERIADLGLKGNADLVVGDYVEGLKEDASILSNAADTRKCRLEVFRELKETLQPGGITNNGDGNVNIQNGDGNTTNVTIGN